MPLRIPQQYGKTAKTGMEVLPFPTREKQAIMMGLVNRVGLKLKQESIMYTRKCTCFYVARWVLSYDVALCPPLPKELWEFQILEGSFY